MVTPSSLSQSLEFVQQPCRLSTGDNRALLCGSDLKGICSSAHDLQGSSNTFEHYIQQKSPLIRFAVFLRSNEGNPLCTRQVFFFPFNTAAWQKQNSAVQYVTNDVSLTADSFHFQFFSLLPSVLLPCASSLV